MEADPLEDPVESYRECGDRPRTNEEIKSKIEEINSRIEWLVNNVNNQSLTDDIDVEDSVNLSELRAMRRALEWAISGRTNIYALRDEYNNEYMDKIWNDTVLVNKGDTSHILPANHNNHSLEEVLSQDSVEGMRTACGQTVDVGGIGSRTIGKGKGICDDCLRAYKKMRKTQSQKRLTGSDW